tara:strand:- start:282 stop:470 length:189 start_codon:yes stop_codon:yes gene_type:complete
MQIPKQRLIQIIKEELERAEINEPPTATKEGAGKDMGSVKTREDLERIIGNELVALLEKSNS